MAFLQAAHVLERINYLFRGKYSYQLMVWHNQAVVLLTSALLGLLAMRIGVRLGLMPGRAFVLGLACQGVYQTFPQNLFYYWEVLPSAVEALLSVAWLIVEEARFERHLDERMPARLRFAAVFLLVWVEPTGAPFIIATYLLALLLLAPDEMKRIPIVQSVVVPAIAGMVLFVMQLAQVLPLSACGSRRIRVPLPHGLDGSTHVVGHWDPLTRKWPRPDWPINFWKALFVAGVAGLLTVMVYRFATRLPPAQLGVRVGGRAGAVRAVCVRLLPGHCHPPVRIRHLPPDAACACLLWDYARPLGDLHEAFRTLCVCRHPGGVVLRMGSSENLCDGVPTRLLVATVVTEVHRYLLTGAAGFVGARVCERIVSRGGDVHAALGPATNPWRQARKTAALLF